MIKFFANYSFIELESVLFSSTLISNIDKSLARCN